MRKFNSKADVETLTVNERNEIMKMAFDRLVEIGNEYNWGITMSDDGSDYMRAAVDNYHDLFEMLDDGDDDLYDMKSWLLVDPYGDEGCWGACDGEIRFELFTDEYIDSFDK